MLREVNTDVLIDLKITAHQLIIILLLMDEHYDHLEKYLIETNSYDTFLSDLNRLSELQLLTYPNDRPYNYKSIEVQDKFIKTLHKDDMFMELFDTFPLKVTRPNGMVDYLKKDKRMCEDAYSIFSKNNRHRHEHIMNCLRYELAYRNRTNSLSWMKRLGKWISSREWENYEDLVANGSQLTKIQEYGSQLE